MQLLQNFLATRVVDLPPSIRRLVDVRKGFRGYTQSPLRILVADGSEVARVGLKATLERRTGWEVVAEAANGNDAIAAAASTNVDVAIVESSLPVVDGIEVARRIRTQLPHVEVLILANEQNEATIRQALRAGARAILLKSDGEENLLAAVALLRQSDFFMVGKFSPQVLRDAIRNQSAEIH
jgi:DNA-binding NarL/FixJ family response regulator